VGTPARRVLFESHRDGRVCRVARDSSSSDSNLLRMMLGAILRSRSRLTTRIARGRSRGSRSRAVGRTLLFLASVPGLVNGHARSSTYPGTRVLERGTRSRSWTAILGTPVFLRAIFRPREIADDRLAEYRRKSPSRHLTTRTLDPAGRIVRSFSDLSPTCHRGAKRVR